MENLMGMLIATACLVAWHIFVWRKRKVKFIIISSLVFAALNYGGMSLCDYWWETGDSVWWNLLISGIMYFPSQLISFITMPMNGREILRQYKVPVWHDKYSEDTLIENIVAEARCSKKNYKNKDAYAASSQMYQILGIREVVHPLLCELQMKEAILMENVTVGEFQKRVSEILYHMVYMGDKKNRDTMKCLADIFIDVYIVSRLNWMPTKTSDGLFDLRSPYEKEMEWRKQNLK